MSTMSNPEIRDYLHANHPHVKLTQPTHAGEGQLGFMHRMTGSFIIAPAPNAADSFHGFTTRLDEIAQKLDISKPEMDALFDQATVNLDEAKEEAEQAIRFDDWAFARRAINAAENATAIREAYTWINRRRVNIAWQRREAAKQGK